ncbi:MAG: hypothetical protein GY851_24665, partial [bacterium]|nr:hypothetical protein [bacterium]
MPLVDDIATALEVSHGTACKIAKLTKLPDRAKSIREDSYWRKVAKVCKRHDITAGRILELASKRKRGRVPVPVGADAGTQARAPHAGDEPGGRHELGSFEASLESLRLSVATIGAAVSSNGTEDRTDLQLIDRYAKLQSELRQSEKEWLALQKEYALIFRRGDVYETTSTLWVAFRAAIDSLMSQITESTNLPAWLEEMGGSIGDEDQR